MKTTGKYFAFIFIAVLMLTLAAPGVFAQPQYRNQGRNAPYAQDGRYHQERGDRDYDRRNQDYRYDDYYDYDNRRSVRDGWKRTGIGAAIGAGGGAIMGGRKGALIGAAIGAAGGYIYHRTKENRRRY